MSILRGVSETPPGTPLCAIAAALGEGDWRYIACMNGRIAMNIRANNIFRAFARAVGRSPHGEALIFQNRTWTYSQLYVAAHQAAATMAAHGVLSGDRIAFMGHNSDAYVIGFLATQLLSAIHVPINFMLQPGEVQFILQHSGSRMLFVDAKCCGVARTAVQSFGLNVDLVELETLGKNMPGVAPDLGGGHADVSTPAQLAYTSGTESRPKGALLGDNGLLLQYMSCIEAGDYAASDVVIHALPLFHCAQMHCFLVPSLLLGARNVLLMNAEPSHVLDSIRAYRGTAFFAPPTVWIGVLANAAFNPHDLRSLQKGYYGASIMPAEILTRLQKNLPWLELWNFYGQTEIGPLATALRPEDHATRPASVGRPVLFVETRVVDEDMLPVSPGTVGEIVHRSPQLLIEYYRDPERTAEAFCDGWFRSGDLGVIDDEGYLTVVDRKKDMIKTGGENVASREVEEVIYKHAGVAEVAVVGRPDEIWVERVCAYVVLKKGFRATAEDIISRTGELAAFKRPKEVIFVEALPKNPSGKVVKRDLRK
jgi:fatty-acyl-CoA synthase